MLGFGGALGIATPPAAYSPNPPLHEGYSLTTSVSIRLLPGLGDDMVSPLPPRRLRRRRRLSSFPRRLSRAPGPGSEEPAAAPAPRWRWQHPRGPVGSSQPPPRPPHGGTPGTVRPSGGGDPAAPGSGCSSPAVVPPRPGPAPARRCAARRSLLPALALSPARRSPSRWLPSSLQDQQTTPALSASLPQPRSGRRDVTSVTSSVGAVPRAKGVGRRRNVDFLGGFWEM